MNGKQPTRGNQRRRQQGRPNRPTDIWRTPGPLPELEPITPWSEPSAMIRSLGDPPMNAAVAAGGYFATVVDRVAGMAQVLVLTLPPEQQARLAPPTDA